MVFSKNEMALALAAAVIIMLLSTSAIGIATGFFYGDIKITQEQFSQAWQFTTIFAGAALMYFGFRAGQANGSSAPQS
jgi:high-affinity Fe2+/Pb2+ permease